MGYVKYNQYLSLLCLSKDNIYNEEEMELLKNIDIFLILFKTCMKNDEFRNEFCEAIELFFREKPLLSDKGFFYFGEIEDKRWISNDNFNKVVELIKIKNNIEDVSNNNLNPANEKAKEILEKRKKAREIVAKAKNKNIEDELTFSDLISILCANGNSINIFNIWDLTIYQFNDQFNRMRMLKDYNVNIQSLLAGADPKKIELKHWMSKT